MFIIKYFDEWQRTQNNSAQLKLLSCVAYIINENHPLTMRLVFTLTPDTYTDQISILKPFI